MRYLARKTDGVLLSENDDGSWSFVSQLGNTVYKYSRENLSDKFFEEVTEENFPALKERGIEYHAWIKWSTRNDGHGGIKGGTLEDFRNLPEFKRKRYLK